MKANKPEAKVEGSKLKNKIMGYIEMVGGALLLVTSHMGAATVFVMPQAVLFVGVTGVGALAVDEFINGEKVDADGKAIPIFKRIGKSIMNAASTAFGTGIGLLTITGAIIIAVVGIKEGIYGNAEGFSVASGALMGVAVNLSVAAVAAVCIGEGAYKAVTGKDCAVVGQALSYAKSFCLGARDIIMRTKVPTKENIINSVTAAVDKTGKVVSEDIEKVKKVIKEDIKKVEQEAPGLVTSMKHMVGAACHSVADLVHNVGHAHEVEKKKHTPTKEGKPSKAVAKNK